MDAEIAVLEAKLAKARQIKQGMMQELLTGRIRLVGGHPMHLDITADQLLVLRPLPGLGGYRTPIKGLYLSGAGTNPAGGVVGAPGRNAAGAVLADVHRTRRTVASAAFAAAAVGAGWAGTQRRHGRHA
jgi:hypothetical protein